VSYCAAKRISGFAMNIDTLPSLLNQNPGLIVVKFQADWCKPCRRIEPHVKKWLDRRPQWVHAYIVDVDEDSRLYSYYVNKRLVRGIPAIIVFAQGNTTPIFDDSVNSSDLGEIDTFFAKWFRLPVL
jgi:thiol-disulfide isomerase/thioredoxin